MLSSKVATHIYYLIFYDIDYTIFFNKKQANKLKFYKLLSFERDNSILQIVFLV